MMKLLTKVYVLLLCVAIAAAFALVGCGSSTPSEAEQAQQANRAYMSQVNEIMEELDSTLDSFSDAVARDDLVSMSIETGNAKRVIDKLVALDAPEVFADVQEQYASAVQKLYAALEKYIALYTEAKKAPDVDYSGQLVEVQKAYDEGIAALQAADDTVAAM